MTAGAMVRVSHTGFTVSSIAKAAAFFEGVLGFAISPTTRQAGPMVERMTGVPGAELDIAFATGGGHTIELIQYIAPVSPGTPDKRPCDPGFAHLAILVDDIDAIVRTVEAAGYDAVSPPQIVPAGPRKGGKNVYTRGPDGIVIEFQQAPPTALSEK